MADDVKVTYEIPGFERRRPRTADEQTLPQDNDESAEVIVISSDDDEDDNPGRGHQNQIKIEDIKSDLSVDVFDPTSSPVLNPFRYPNPIPNVDQRSFLTPNQQTHRTSSNESVRMFAAKSTTHTLIPTATAKFPASNQPCPENTAQSFTTNEIKRSYTPNGRESVFTKRSTPESGFVDQLFEDYQSEIDHGYTPPPPAMRTVWSSKQGYKAPASNTSKSVVQLNPKTSIRPETVQFSSNEQNQLNVQSDQTSKTSTIDPKTAEYIANLIHKAVSGNFAVVPKKEGTSDQDENELLEEIRPNTSSSSSATMSESDSGSDESNHQRSNRKRISKGKSTKSSIDKRRKHSNDSEMSSSSVASSDSYRPASEDEYDEDDEDDEDLDSTISMETEPMAGTSRSPQYEPESDFDYECEIDSDGDSDGMESEETWTSASSQYESDDGSEVLMQPRGQRNTDKSLYWVSRKAQICPLCHKKSKGRMVAHFTTNHKKSEVFVSRISTKMVDLIKSGKRSVKTDTRTYVGSAKIRVNSTVQTICAFCEEEKNFPLSYWVDHIRSHTGEYGNSCRVCNKRVSFNNHCGYGTIKKDGFDLRTNDLYAYRCVDCNFVQTRYKNIETHLKGQHQLSTIGKKDYEKFILMPAYKHITKRKSNNPRGEHHQDIPRKPQSRCNVHPVKNVATELGSASKLGLQSRTQVRTPRSSEPITTSNAVLSALKNDPGDEEILLLVHKEYKALEKLKNSSKSPYAVAVRPYILGDYAKKRNINIVTQYALFKCMYEWCIYATNSENDWEIHMGRHIQLMDAISKTSVINKDYRSELIKFRECCYCGSEAEDKKHSAHQVCHHMEMQHSRNNFQCAFCFYRTVETDNMVLHMEAYHPNANHEILVYDVHREFQQKDEEILQDGCDQYITKIKCGQGKCTKKFVSYSALYVHHNVEHAAKVLQCSYCLTPMKCAKTQMQEHLTRMHSRYHFEEFQCVYCEIGGNSVEQMRWHMSEKHASKFLFVGARWNCNSAKTSADELQIVYIGDAKDYASYKLYTCSNFDALNRLDPKELSPNKQFEKLTEITNNTRIKAEYFGRMPSISYKFTKKFAEKKFISLDQYWNLHPARAPSASSTKPPVQQEKRVQFKLSIPNNDRTTCQNNQNTHRANDKSLNAIFPPNLKHSTRPDVLIKFIPSPSEVPSALIASVKYICITEKLYGDLITINETERPIRRCYVCNMSKQINNDKDLYAYVDHFIDKHPCQNSGKMPSIEGIQNHRLKYHKRQPLVCLKIKRSNDSSVYELFKFRYECQKCEKRFDTHQEIDLHIYQKHPTIVQQFGSQKIVPESMVLKID